MEGDLSTIKCLGRHFLRRSEVGCFPFPSVLVSTPGARAAARRHFAPSKPLLVMEDGEEVQGMHPSVDSILESRGKRKKTPSATGNRGGRGLGSADTDTHMEPLAEDEDNGENVQISLPSPSSSGSGLCSAWCLVSGDGGGEGRVLSTAASRVMGENKDAVAPPGKEDEMAPQSEAEMWKVDPAAKLGNGGVILVLFETPSGFALFGYDGVRLFLPDAIQDIWGEFVMDFMHPAWLKAFQAFEDKASALNQATGVSPDLESMILRWIKPNQTLAVGKKEYKTIIEHCLGISCLFNDEVMELMWGLNNQMQYLLPDEHSKLPKEDRFPMCKGMSFVLNFYGFDVKPEMVNKSIIEATGLVYECDYNVKKHAQQLHFAGEHLKKSQIDYEDWDLLKLATALMIVSYPKGEQIVAGDLQELFGDDYSTLVRDAPKYEGKVLGMACFTVYEEMLQARKVRFKALRRLGALIRKARKTFEAEQAMMCPE